MTLRSVRGILLIVLGVSLFSACLSPSATSDPSLQVPAQSGAGAQPAPGTPASGATPGDTATAGGTPSAGATALTPAPLISRGKTAVASLDVETPAAVVDGRYCTWPAWRTSTFPTWLAVDVGRGPSRLLFQWSNHSSGYSTTGDVPSYGIPASYQIQTSADSTNGTNGTWTTVVDVHDNNLATREHVFPFAGQSWVRMTVTGMAPGTVDNMLAIQEIDIHDASQGEGVNDSVLFMGDSITEAGYTACDNVQPSYAELVHAAHPAYFPTMIDAGVGGVNSSYGPEMIDAWLAENPDVHIWAIGYGTNDAWQSVPPEVFRQNLQTVIDAVKQAGKVPVLARIPFALKGPKDENIQALNQVIDDLTACNSLIVGPDLYSWFKDHPGELGSDGVHPTAAGSISLNRLWYQALEPLYTGQTPRRGSPTASCAPTATGSPVSASPAAGSSATIQGRFLLGVNFPWQSYGNDFGQNAWGAYGVHDPATYAKVDQDFATLAASGVNSVRWFVFGDGRAGIRFDSSGMPVGLDDEVFADFDAALQIAKRHGIVIDFVLLDFMFMRDARIENGVQLGGHASVIDTTQGQDALLHNVFDPLFERYGSNPSILSWEVMNEPELALKEVSNRDSQVSQPSSLANFQQFTRRFADEVHAKTTSKATLGSLSAEWVGKWQGLGLDYYQVHYYDWMSDRKAANLFADSAPELKLDRPVVVGEFPAANSKTASLGQYLDRWYAAGFAGAWVWSWNADDQAGKADLSVISSWAAAHPPS